MSLIVHVPLYTFLMEILGSNLGYMSLHLTQLTMAKENGRIDYWGDDNNYTCFPFIFQFPNNSGLPASTANLLSKSEVLAKVSFLNLISFSLK